MLGIILGVVGLAGGGGIVALVARFGLKVVLGKAASIGRAVPPKGWLAIAVASALAIGFIVHQRHAHAALKAADSGGYARAVKVYQRALAIVHARAVKRRLAAEATGRAISTKTKEANDAQNRDIARRADDQRLRGPGKAAAGCGPVYNSGISAAGGQPGAGDHRPADAGGTVLPDGDRPADRAVVPWNWLTGRGEQCDLDRAEALTWRSWYQQQAKAWEAMRAGAK